MDRHFENHRLLPQQGQELLAIRIVPHNGLSVIAALNDVVRVSGNSEAGLAGHEELLEENFSLIGI
jgi:hypothetical protein